MPWNPLDDLSESQFEQIEAYEQLLLHFNDKINLISREDEDQVRWHVRHCLTLSYRSFPQGSVVVDWGTGGGLPAVPLAVRFPSVRFHAVDAVRKKVQAVRTMARRLELDNLEAHHMRAEQWVTPHHYSVSRATAPLATLWEWHCQAAVVPGDPHADEEWTPGLWCLKGGDITSEITDIKEEENEVRIEHVRLEDLVDAADMTDKLIVGIHPVD